MPTPAIQAAAEPPLPFERLSLAVLGAGLLVPLSALASVLVVVALSPFLVSDPGLASVSDFDSPARLRRLSDLKSVSYQPPPLSRNPTGDISRFKDTWPHAGQSVRVGSENFCKASNL